jgi:hypothetical protein
MKTGGDWDPSGNSPVKPGRGRQADGAGEGRGFCRLRGEKAKLLTNWNCKKRAGEEVCGIKLEIYGVRLVHAAQKKNT